MTLGNVTRSPDPVDLKILSLLQANCKLPLVRIGRQVGLTAPSVIERIRKLEEGGVITGYHAHLDSRRLGKDVTGFIGVVVNDASKVETFVQGLGEFPDVLECHHVTGAYTFLLKIKTESTKSLEELIRGVRSIGGVMRTETMIALSTQTEHARLSLAAGSGPDRTTSYVARRGRSQTNGRRPRHGLGGQARRNPDGTAVARPQRRM